jgi:hypothetical protein
MKEITINIFEKLGSTAAVSSEDGEQLFVLIMKALNNNILIILDFNNIELITSTFLNAAIGQLYNKFDSKFLRKHLQVENMDNDDLLLLKKVVDRAKEYFKNKKIVEDGIKEGLNG